MNRWKLKSDIYSSSSFNIHLYGIDWTDFFRFSFFFFFLTVGCPCSQTFSYFLWHAGNTVTCCKTRMHTVKQHKDNFFTCMYWHAKITLLPNSMWSSLIFIKQFKWILFNRFKISIKTQYYNFRHQKHQVFLSVIWRMG